VRLVGFYHKNISQGTLIRMSDYLDSCGTEFIFEK